MKRKINTECNGKMKEKCRTKIFAYIFVIQTQVWGHTSASIIIFVMQLLIGFWVGLNVEFDIFNPAALYQNSCKHQNILFTVS